MLNYLGSEMHVSNEIQAKQDKNYYTGTSNLKI